LSTVAGAAGVDVQYGAPKADQRRHFRAPALHLTPVERAGKRSTTRFGPRSASSRGEVAVKAQRLLTRRGVLVEEQGQTYVADSDGDSDEARTLRPLQAAACTYRIAFGPRAGQKVLTL